MALPDGVLRSVLRFAQEPEEALLANLAILSREWHDTAASTLGVDQTLLDFIASLVGKAASAPTHALVYGHFKNAADAGDGVAMAAATRLELLALAPPGLLTGADFRYALDEFRTSLVSQQLQQALLQTSTILSSGLDQPVVKAGQRTVIRLQGAYDALAYLSNELGPLSAVTGKAPAEGMLGTDHLALWKLYEMRRDNPLKTGVLSGLNEIDKVHHGLRPGELALVLGFVGQYKTTFCFSWLYKAAVYQQRNVAAVSCEVPIDDLRMMFYAMHSAHPKFEGHQCWGSISATALAHGALSKAQEKFLRTVSQDLETCTDYGKLYYREPSPSMTLVDIQRWAEGHHRRTPLDLLLIDYLGLIRPTPGSVGNNAGTGERLNEVMRQAKLLAMGFAAGDGIGILSPFQANREGWKNAVKVGGRYDLTALSWANEAERSADLIYYVFLDDALRQTRELAVGNLKTRFVPLITDQFRVYADPLTRIIDNLDLTQPLQAPVDLD